MKRNRFGRQVTKSSRSFPTMNISDAGPSDPGKVKTKTVRKGNTLKTRQVIKQDGERTVNKTKKYQTSDNSVTKKTVKSGGKTDRSVTINKPGETSRRVGIKTAAGQARSYNYNVKKLKK